MFFTQKLSLKFRPGLTKERVDLHEIEHYRSNVIIEYFLPVLYIDFVRNEGGGNTFGKTSTYKHFCA